MAWILALFWVLSVSIVTLLSFWWDKRQARLGGWRVRESTLLMLALLGGALGAKYGQYSFRHKTRKQPFAGMLNLILVLHFCGLIAAFASVRFEIPIADIVRPIFDQSGESVSEEATPRRSGPES